METNPESQRCGMCKQDKTMDAFSLSYRGKTGTWCRECFSRYHRMRTAGIKLMSAPHQLRTCEWCGAEYQPTQLKSNVKFCSRKCKDTAKNRARQKKTNEAKPERKCPWCGDLLPKERTSRASYCSAKCNELAHKRTRNYRRRKAPAESLRPRKEPLIRFADIADRDGWRCGICGGKVSKEKAWPDPMAPSLDHVIPLSKGGEALNPANLRLAHLQCNTTRRDKGGGEQLRLLG